MKPGGIILLLETGQHIRLLPDDEAGQLFKSLFDYAENGTIPNLTPAAQMAFSFIRAYLDANAEKYAQTIEKRRAAGRLGAAATNGKRQQNPANAEFDAAKPPISKAKSNSKYKLKYDSLDNMADKPRRAPFKPPTLPELESYFSEKGSTKAEAQKCFYYYQSKNWTVGRSKMADWRAAAQGWIARAGQYQQPKQSTGSLADKYADL